MGLHRWLQFDMEQAVREITRRFREAVTLTLSRRGAVVAVSGGVDSSVCAALATEAFGKDKVYGLILPERDSSPSSRLLGEELCRQLDIPYEVKDIAPTLEAIGCYAWRDNAIRMVFPEYGPDWKNKILISQGLLDSDRMNFFKLVVERPDGEMMEKRLPLKAYLQIVAATNFKQRVRKTLEYFHADRLNFAVTGTPNRLEYDQGFFVKNGDGAADVKPIAHLYKSQVYEMGRFLRLPESILSSRPSTDTYSLAQSQEEFYFVLPHEKMDLVLCGFNAERSPEDVGSETGLTPEQVLRVFRDIQVKRRTTSALHMKPILMAPVPEIVV